MMRSQEVKEISSIAKDVFPPLRAESLTSGTLSLESTVDEAETWARKLFPDVNKFIQVPTEMSSKASKKPDNQAKKTVKTEEFSSNSTAQEMNDTVIPGLFVENLKNSKRAKRAKKFKVMRLQQKVLQLYKFFIQRKAPTNKKSLGKTDSVRCCTASPMVCFLTFFVPCMNEF